MKEEKVYFTSGKKKASARRETNAVSGMRVMIVHQNRHQNPLHPLSHQHIGVLPNVNSIKLNRVMCARLHTGRLKVNPEETKKGGDKRAVAIVRSVRQLGCVSQDAEPPESVSISRKGPKVLGSFRRVRFTQSTLRRARIRENKGPSLGKIQVKAPHQRSPYAVKVEDRSQEKTERQERWARGKAWNLGRHFYKLQEKDKATFFSPTDEWILPAASTIKPVEREFVADSGASMHMVSKRDLVSAELETMRISKNPTTVMTANGEVQTREEATVCVRGLVLVVTVMLLEETPAVVSLGKLCEDHGNTFHSTSGEKPHLTKKGKRINCNIASYVPFVVRGLSTSSSTSSSPASTSSSQDTVISTENPATERSEIYE